MPIFVTIAGEKLFTGRTVAEIDAMTVAEIDAMTVGELQAFQNTNIVTTDSQSPEISHRIEERSTASLPVLDLDMTKAYDVGQEVIIEDSMDRLFGGLIDSVSIAALRPDGCWIHTVTCIDYQALADRRVFRKAYVSTTADAIVRDILDILDEEDVTEGEIQAGPTIENITFDVSCAEAMVTVCERAGFTWFIDEWKRLYFVVRTTYDAGWDIAGGSEILWNPPPRLEIGNPNYVNVQYEQSGNAQTSSQTRQFKGDGKNQTFVVQFPIATEPTITVSSNGGAPVAKTVGIGEVNPTGYDYYWNEGSPSVSQDLTATPPADTDVVSVTYTGYFKLMAKATQTSEVTRQRLAQGFGTGFVEAMHKDISLKSQDSAIDAAKAKLAAYASIGRKLQYSTHANGLAVGVMQEVTLSSLGLSAASMLIYSMNITWPKGVTTYAIEACEGPVEQSWQNIFCGIASELRKQAGEQAGEADVVQGLEEFTKVWYETDHPNPFIKVYPDGVTTPASVDFPCLATEDRLSHVVLYDAYDQEFYRQQITLQEDASDARSILTTCLILAADGNGQITAVALWGGVEASTVAGTGIEMSKHSWSKLKNSLESAQINCTDEMDSGWV